MNKTNLTVGLSLFHTAIIKVPMANVLNKDENTQKNSFINKLLLETTLLYKLKTSLPLSIYVILANAANKEIEAISVTTESVFDIMEEYRVIPNWFAIERDDLNVVNAYTNIITLIRFNDGVALFNKYKKLPLSELNPSIRKPANIFTAITMSNMVPIFTEFSFI